MNTLLVRLTRAGSSATQQSGGRELASLHCLGGAVHIAAACVRSRCDRATVSCDRIFFSGTIVLDSGLDGARQTQKRPSLRRRRIEVVYSYTSLSIAMDWHFLEYDSPAPIAAQSGFREPAKYDSRLVSGHKVAQEENMLR